MKIWVKYGDRFPFAEKDLNSAAVNGSVVTAEFGFNLHYTEKEPAAIIRLDAPVFRSH